MKKIEEAAAIDRVARIITRILEICHWVAAALMIAAAVCSVIMPQRMGMFVGYSLTQDGAELSVYGFEVKAPVVDGMADTTVFVLFSVGAVIIICLMAMVFRRLNGVIARSMSSTPFTADNVRAVGQMGVMLMALPVVGFAMGNIIRVVAGVDAAEISNSVEGFVMGIIALCLARIFARGVRLERDVDGLV